MFVGANKSFLCLNFMFVGSLQDFQQQHELDAMHHCSHHKWNSTTHWFTFIAQFRLQIFHSFVMYAHWGANSVAFMCHFYFLSPSNQSHWQWQSITLYTSSLWMPFKLAEAAHRRRRIYAKYFVCRSMVWYVANSVTASRPVIVLDHNFSQFIKQVALL